MKYNLAILSLSLIIAGCAAPRPAPVELKGEKFYGRDSQNETNADGDVNPDFNKDFKYKGSRSGVSSEDTSYNGSDYAPAPEIKKSPFKEDSSIKSTKLSPPTVNENIDEGEYESSAIRVPSLRDKIDNYKTNINEDLDKNDPEVKAKSSEYLDLSSVEGHKAAKFENKPELKVKSKPEPELKPVVEEKSYTQERTDKLSGIAPRNKPKNLGTITIDEQLASDVKEIKSDLKEIKEAKEAKAEAKEVKPMHVEYTNIEPKSKPDISDKPAKEEKAPEKEVKEKEEPKEKEVAIKIPEAPAKEVKKAETKPKAEVKAEPKAKPKAEPAPKAEAKAEPKPEPEAKPEPKAEPKQEVKIEKAETIQIPDAKPLDIASIPKIETTPAGSSKFIKPVEGKIVQEFTPSNDGITIQAPEGSAVKAAGGGEVVYSGNQLQAYGNMIVIKHPNGFLTAYSHLEDLSIKKGSKVSQGDVIGKVGKTGNVSSPQLHFGIRKGRSAVNPRDYLN